MNGRQDANERMARFWEIVNGYSISCFSEQVTDWEKLLQRLLDGESLWEICQSMGLPQGRMLSWIIRDDRRYTIYKRAIAERRIHPEPHRDGEV